MSLRKPSQSVIALTLFLCSRKEDDAFDFSNEEESDFAWLEVRDSCVCLWQCFMV